MLGERLDDLPPVIGLGGGNLEEDVLDSGVRELRQAIQHSAGGPEEKVTIREP